MGLGVTLGEFRVSEVNGVGFGFAKGKGEVV